MMISKERENIMQLLGRRLFSIGQEQVSQHVPQREGLLEMIARLTGMFFLNRNGGNTQGEASNADYYCLGKIFTREKAKGRANLIQGHQLLLSVVLLLIFLHRRLIENSNGTSLRNLVEFCQFGEGKINPDVDGCSHVLTALLDGRESALGEMTGPSCQLVERYRDIETFFPPEIDNDALPSFADWLVWNVTLDQIIAHSEEGSRILQNALAFEKKVCISQGNRLSL